MFSPTQTQEIWCGVSNSSFALPLDELKIAKSESELTIIVFLNKILYCDV